MEKTVKNKNGLVLAFSILFIAFQAISIICDNLESIGFQLSQIMASVIMALVCIFLYFSYRNHVKNVMKPLLGASLILSLGQEMSVVSYVIENVLLTSSGTTTFGENVSTMVIYCVINILLFAIIVGINIIHYMINSTHESSTNLVKLNNVLYVFYIILICVRVAMLIICNGATALGAVSTITSEFAYAFTKGIVLTIELSLDEYKVAREQEEN